MLAVGLIAAFAYLLLDTMARDTRDEPALASGADAERHGLPTVAVLPFQVLGDDPEQAYLARGPAADLATDLSRLTGLAVIGAGPTTESPSPDAGAEGNAQYQVWGGVRRTAGHLLIEVRLTDAETGRQLWAKRYDRPYSDLFAVQDEIGTRIAETLAVRLTEAERQRLARRYSRSTEAYDLLLRAQQELLARQQPANAQARGLYRQALAKDPAFARAYAGLALTYAADYRNQWTDDGQAALRRALEMAQTAVDIDPSLPEAHWALGYVKAQQRRHQEALSHLDQALALVPSFADALALQAGIHTYIGSPADSVPLLRRAMRLDPGAGYLYFLLLGRAYFFLDDAEQALINLREAIARNPTSLEAHIYQAAALLLLGDQDGAAWEAEEIRTIAPDFSTRAWLATYPMTDQAQQARLVSALGQVGL